MAFLTPPPLKPPVVALADHDGLHRVHFRLRILGLTTTTVLATIWVVMMGLVPAILALVVAKHILVAILVMGLGIDAHREELEPFLPPPPQTDD